LTGTRDNALRVLVVAGREPWPLNSGGRLRLHYFLRCISQQAAVTLALPGPTQHAEYLPRPTRLVDMHAPEPKSPAGGMPASAWILRRVHRHYGCDPATLKWLARHAHPGNFDVALLFGAVTGQYVDALRVPAVWDAVDELVLYTIRDAERRGWRAWLRVARAASLYTAFERHVARKCAATIFASTVDASYARRWAGNAQVAAISNGVDFGYFRVPGTVAFVGSLSFPPNVEAVLRFTTRVWPRLRAGRPGRRLLIVGRDAVEAVRRLRHHPQVEVHADVPDIRPFLARACVAVVPTRLGGGVKNKVLEACALARPVVASPRALAGLGARRGVEVLCAGSDRDWVRKLTRLLEDPTAARTVGENGRRWVEREHHWPRLAQQLLALLAQAAHETRSGPGSPGPCGHRFEVAQPAHSAGITPARPDATAMPRRGPRVPAAARRAHKEMACL
jgi:glycosyltransferase involved in cell wall biosynthesis